MSASRPLRRLRAGAEPGDPPPPVRCEPEEIEALKRLAASRTAGIWRIKRAKIILGTLVGRSAERLMWDVRVPIQTVVRFQRTFAELRMAAFDRPDRKPTDREVAVERMLGLLEDPPPEGSPLWDATKVHYIGRDYSAREIAGLRSFLRERPRLSRAELARELCRIFGLHQATGKPRTGIAADILRRMSMDNLIALPPRERRAPRAARPCRTEPALCDRREEPAAEVAVRHLSLVPVQGPRLSQLWREALERHHYIRQHTLYGAQIRYLVYGSDGGQMEPLHAPNPAETRTLLAVLGFASAAWRLTARDQFIGWTDEERARNLKLVVGNARFLILPWVRVKYLASRILGAAARRLPGDWEARYGYRPALLETFVQLDRFAGTCYRAANWVRVGTTKGYSVRGSEARASAPERAIFLYPLRKDFREVLRGTPG